MRRCNFLFTGPALLALLLAARPLAGVEQSIPPSRTSTRIVPHIESWSDMRARDQQHLRRPAKTAAKVWPHRKPELKRLPLGTVLPISLEEPLGELTLQPASAAPARGFAFPGIDREDQVNSFTNSSIPPDTMGAVGLQHFVEMINGSVAIYDKATGQLLSHVSINSFFASRFFDTDFPREDTTNPRVLFDRRSGRWLAAIIETGVENHALLAVSETGDPTGNWCRYLVTLGLPEMVTDYDTLGTDDNGVYLAARLFPTNGSDSAISIAAIEKGPLLAGQPATNHFFDGITNMFSTPQPAHNLDAVPTNGPAWFVASWPYTVTGTDSANLMYSSLVWTGSLGARIPVLRSETRISTPAFDAPRPAPARDTANDVDTGDVALQMAVVRKGKLWTCRNVGINGAGGALNADRTGCEWIQLNLSGRTASLAQRGRVFDRTVGNPRFYYFPSIMVNGQGHAALGFSGSNTNEYIGAWAATRLASDPLNTLRAPFQLKPGEENYDLLDPDDRNRWGDYSYTSLDPTDDMTFWTIQAYAVEGQRFFNVWGTWIAQILAPAPTLNRISASARQGQTNVVLTLTGTRFFDPGTNFPNRLRVRLDGDSAENIDNYVVTYLSSTQVRVRFSIPGNVTPGLYGMVLTNPDGQSVTNFDAFKVLPTADVAVTLAADANPVTVGVPFNYLITVTNRGPSEALNVRLTNTLPPNVCFLSASPPEFCRRSGNTIFCELGGLPSETGQEFVVEVVPIRAGLTTGRASATTTTFEFDRTNNRASFTTMATTNGAPSPQVFLSDATVREGHSGVVSALFNVCLAPASRQTVRFHFTTEDSSAQAGTDYFAATGLLVFTPGQTLKTIAVRVKGDRESESDETFQVFLEPPTNAVLARASGTGTILDDDPPLVAIPVAGAALSGGPLAMTAIARSGEDVHLSFTAIVGHTYCVEWTDRLDGSSWQPVSGAASVAGTGDMVRVIDVKGGSHPQRFYRVHRL